MIHNSLKVILLFDNIAQSLEFMSEETINLGHEKGMKIVKKLEERSKKKGK